MDPTHSRAEMAHLLGISETRLQQLTGLGIVKRSGGLYEPLQTALDYLGYIKRDDEAKAARTRQTNAKALQIEQRVRREQRRMLTLEEVKEIANLMYEGARESAQAESSRFYSEVALAHSETEALAMTYRVYEPVARLANTWRDGVAELLRQIDADELPDAARLDRVLAQLMADIAASNKADAEKMPVKTKAIRTPARSRTRRSKAKQVSPQPIGDFR
jgi:hypothetical protein